jgi:uncharacterized protein YdhG (YjbR/CyaY superfamily)
LAIGYSFSGKPFASLLSAAPVAQNEDWTDPSHEFHLSTSQRPTAVPAKPSTIDEYLAPLSDEKRSALEKLRRAIQSAAPKAEECISYHIPAFRLGGRMLVAFGAAAKHCAFYPGAHPVRAHKNELQAYDTEKGTIRFPADHPLPAALVRKLVKTRIAEYAATKPIVAATAKRRR